jgi:hypothetical protein
MTSSQLCVDVTIRSGASGYEFDLETNLDDKLTGRPLGLSVRRVKQLQKLTEEIGRDNPYRDYKSRKNLKVK